MGNIYDDPVFFDTYAQMDRSRKGLEGAGEWHQLVRLFPDMEGKNVLDLGCGYGWHSKYAAENGAGAVTAIDQSSRMIGEAGKRNADDRITYRSVPWRTTSIRKRPLTLWCPTWCSTTRKI